MNIPSPSMAYRQEKLKTALKAKRGIRAIDRGTIYDVSGQLRGLARDIDKGDEGAITDAVCIIRRENGSVGSFHWGGSGRAIAHHMVSTVKNRLEPS